MSLSSPASPPRRVGGAGLPRRPSPRPWLAELGGPPAAHPPAALLPPSPRPPAAEERAATAGRGRGHGGLQGSRSGGELREGGGAATGGTGRPTAAAAWPAGRRRGQSTPQPPLLLPQLACWTRLARAGGRDGAAGELGGAGGLPRRRVLLRACAPLLAAAASSSLAALRARGADARPYPCPRRRGCSARGGPARRGRAAASLPPSPSLASSPTVARALPPARGHGAHLAATPPRGRAAVALELACLDGTARARRPGFGAGELRAGRRPSSPRPGLPSPPLPRTLSALVTFSPSSAAPPPFHAGPWRLGAGRRELEQGRRRWRPAAGRPSRGPACGPSSRGSASRGGRGGAASGADAARPRDGVGPAPRWRRSARPLSALGLESGVSPATIESEVARPAAAFFSLNRLCKLRCVSLTEPNAGSLSVWRDAGLKRANSYPISCMRCRGHVLLRSSQRCYLATLELYFAG
ncbi:hypothetical protein PVAP13_9KG471587 [Panicum virgatum]|uniref:Uncharacterized protein n=1 Tax=Panicum virgatum TaxID=38727 RepID=A0A8T0NGH2_PANVG|nr:hypothetical protein PVAP13_9KG471587 [Panicum virgatum]